MTATEVPFRPGAPDQIARRQRMRRRDGDLIPPYVYREDIEMAVNAALITDRPLLLRGEPVLDVVRVAQLDYSVHQWLADNATGEGLERGVAKFPSFAEALHEPFRLWTVAVKAKKATRTMVENALRQTCAACCEESGLNALLGRVADLEPFHIATRELDTP